MCIRKRNFTGAFLHNLPSVGTVPSEKQLQTSPKYKRVFIFGIDGAGDYFSKCDVPSFKRIFEKGSCSFTALSQYPTISAQNWTSILHGVRYQTHQITNEIASCLSYNKNRYPSVFKMYAKGHPEAQFASVVNWFPINRGIVENGITGMKKINGSIVKIGKTDKEVDELVLKETLDYLTKEDPSVFFVHFDNPDHMGHQFGYGTKEYEEAVQTVDGYLGQIYDLCEKRNFVEDTLFILVTDHGHKLPEKGKVGGGHGGWSETERKVTIAVAGKKDVIHGTMGKASTQDVASICLYALGQKQPSSWESSVPHNIFMSLK